jgi:hypothetical protein
VRPQFAGHVPDLIARRIGFDHILGKGLSAVIDSPCKGARLSPLHLTDKGWVFEEFRTGCRLVFTHAQRYKSRLVTTGQITHPAYVVR